MFFCYRYAGPVIDTDVLAKAAEGGPTSVVFTQLVEWLVECIADLAGLDERVHAISGLYQVMLKLSKLQDERVP